MIGQQMFHRHNSTNRNSRDLLLMQAAERNNNSDELRRLIMRSAINGPQGSGHEYFNAYFRSGNPLIHPLLGDLRELACEMERLCQIPGMNLVACVIRRYENLADDPSPSSGAHLQ